MHSPKIYLLTTGGLHQFHNSLHIPVTRLMFVSPAFLILLNNRCVALFYVL